MLKYLYSIIFSAQVAFGAQQVTLTNLSQLSAASAPGTNVLLYLVQITTNGITPVYTPKKFTPSLAGIESITGVDLASLVDQTTLSNAIVTLLAGKQPTFTTTVGLTILSNVLLLQLSAGTNIVLTTNGNQISLNNPVINLWTNIGSDIVQLVGSTNITIDTNVGQITTYNIQSGLYANGTAFSTNVWFTVWPEGISAGSRNSAGTPTATWMFIRPDAIDGSVPYTLGSRLTHTTGNMYVLSNGPTVIDTTAAISGWGGAGTKVKYDDGTYKTPPAGGVAGSMINTTAPIVGQIPYATDTTKTNWAPSGGLIAGASTNVQSTGNLTANTLVGTNGVSGDNFTGTGLTSDSRADFPNDAGTFYFGLQAYDTSTANFNLISPPAPFTAIPFYNNTAASNVYITNLVIGSNLSLSGNTLNASGGAASDNWVASGTTNSTLAGSGFLYNLTATNTIIAGTGAENHLYTTTTGQVVTIFNGTSASPNVNTNPAVKINRILSLTTNSISGDGGESAAALTVANTGVITNAVQVVGIHSSAISYSTNQQTSGGDDAAAIYGTADSQGTGYGIGGFFLGRRSTVAGHAEAIEAAIGNYTTNKDIYLNTGYATNAGISIASVGTTNAAVAVQILNPFGQQFDVGLGFPGLVVLGTTGAVTSATISDDGNANNSIRINGAHTNAAIAIAPGSGSVAIGKTNAPTTTKLTIVGTTTNASGFQLDGFNGANQLSTRLDNDGRLDLSSFGTSGGIVRLSQLGTPAINQLLGHYAAGGFDQNLQQHTFGMVAFTQTAILSNALDSKIDLGFMDTLNGSPGGTYAYQQPNKYVTIQKTGVSFPDLLPLKFGQTNNVASSGDIRFQVTNSIKFRNAANNADVVLAQGVGTDAIFYGAGSSSLTFQVGGSSIVNIGSTGMFPLTDLGIDLGTESFNWRKVSSPIHKAPNGSGTDGAATGLTLGGGAGTGTGRGGYVNIRTSPSGSTGSATNAWSTRYQAMAKSVTLTEASATTVATIAVPTSKIVGGSITVTVNANDASDFQCRTITLPFSAINKAGTVTAGVGTSGTANEAVAVSTGTLTATITAVANGSAVDLKVNATSSLTQTTLQAWVQLNLNSNDTAAVTEI